MTPGTHLDRGGAGAVICGLGGALPDHLVPNAVLCDQLNVSPEWIVTRTGITHRARAREHVSSSGTQYPRQRGLHAWQRSDRKSVV